MDLYIGVQAGRRAENGSAKDSERRTSFRHGVSPGVLRMMAQDVDCRRLRGEMLLFSR
jgi:hypothetical protein